MIKYVTQTQFNKKQHKLEHYDDNLTLTSYYLKRAMEGGQSGDFFQKNINKPLLEKQSP